MLEAKPKVLREIVARDLLRFLDYVRIPDPPPVGSGSIGFKRWEHIIKLHEAVEAVPRGGTLPHLKARKLGVTSYFEARFLWSAMFQGGAFLPVISQEKSKPTRSFVTAVSSGNISPTIYRVSC